MDGKWGLPPEIIDALEGGATVVTGNHRAARTLRRAFDRHQRDLGLKTWQPAAVTAWESWTAALWHRLLKEGHAAQLVLNRSQEQAVWRTVLEADDELASLKTVDSLSQMAAEAWSLACSYNARRRLRDTMAGNSDTRSFQRWAAMFERLCRTEDFISPSQLEEALHGFIEAGAPRLSTERIVMVGFDALTPAQIRLVTGMRRAGVDVSELAPTMDASTQMLVKATDEGEELSLAARWTRTFLEQHPEARVAVIVPALERERVEIDRVFREVLAPELQDIRAKSDRSPYEFSVGKALSDVAMIAAALNLMRWAIRPLALDTITALLLSPYFAMADEERSTRAKFDAFELRTIRTLRPEISLQAALTAIERSKRRSKLHRLLGVLRQMVVAAGRLNAGTPKSHAEWTADMRDFLDAAAWSSGPRESSIDFQLRRKWESALDELATLDFDGTRVDFAQALESLEQIARQTIFAPESREAPVQIMGPLEAAGSAFDAVWLLRSGELNWPPETSTNPLLPWHLQRELGMPGADISRDAEYARRITQRIAACAPTVLFSYAHETKDGRQRPSPALAGLQQMQHADAEALAGESVERTILAVEEVEDTARVQELPDRIVPGGARVLQLQAACGFRAFAEQRLWSTELKSVETGMDARESGTVIHTVLETFWREVKTQEALKSMTEGEREEALDWCIAQGLNTVIESSDTAWDLAYLEMQRERLRRLLRGWLTLEAERAMPFEVKLSEKEFNDVHVGPLRLSVRMDRVDTMDGGEVLIDYKTGHASPDDWLTNRPDAPQLPLYAILSTADRLQGVAFGLVRAGDRRALRGYAAADGVLPGMARMKEAPTLEAQVARWRQVLVQLAEEFHQGDVRVRPKSYPETCARCGQRLLCRLDVNSMQDEGEERGATASEEDRG